MASHIVLIRHASAEVKSNGGDSDRALTSQGRDESRIAARVFKDFEVPKAQRIFTSGYKRAEQTLAEFSSGKDAKVIRNETFFPEGDVAGAVALIKETLLEMSLKFENPCVWVVGHNPSLEKILARLSPSIFECLQELQKASSVWIEWESNVRDLAGEPRLRAFYPKPRP